MSEETKSKTTYTVKVSGTPNPKSREFACDACQVVWEKLVLDDERHSQTCDICGGEARYILSAPPWWENSKAERQRKLKERSAAHSADCRKRGIDPSSTGENHGNEEWRARRRAKKTSSHIIEQHANAHKGWEPGRHLFPGSPEI